MTTTISGTTGVSQVQDGSITTADIADNQVTPAKTELGALPSCIRLNTANGYGSTNTKIRRFTNVVLNQGTDITYADSATLGASFTINKSGVYAISYNDQFSAVEWVGLSLNTSAPTANIYSISAAEILSVGYATTGGVSVLAQTAAFFTVGSIIRAHTTGISTGANVNCCQFTITRVA